MAPRTSPVVGEDGFQVVNYDNKRSNTALGLPRDPHEIEPKAPAKRPRWKTHYKPQYDDAAIWRRRQRQEGQGRGSQGRGQQQAAPRSYSAALQSKADREIQGALPGWYKGPEWGHRQSNKVKAEASDTQTSTDSKVLLIT